MTIISVIGLLATINATSQSDPKAILREAANACRRLNSVKYAVETKMHGTTIKASYTEKRISGTAGEARAATFHVAGEMRDGMGSVEPFEYAFDGRTLFVRGEADSIRMFENADEYLMGQQIGVKMMGQLPLFNDFLGRMAKDAKLRYIGKERVGAWTCDVVEMERRINHPEGGEVSLVTQWSFDQATHLPIRLASSTMTTVVRSLVVDPQLASDAFRIAGKKVKGAPISPQSLKLLDVGAAAPNFTLPDSKGKPRSLKEFRGKVVLIDFWGTWCAPCRKSMPILQGLYEKHRSKGFVVLGIAVADKEGDPAGYMKRQKFTYQLLMNGDQTAKRYKAVVLPTLYLLDKTGNIVYRQAGTDRKDKERLTGLIEKLVQQS